MQMNRLQSVLLAGMLVGQAGGCGGRVSTAPWLDPGGPAGAAGTASGGSEGGSEAGSTTGSGGTTGTGVAVTSPCGAPPWVTLGQVENVREMGGIPLGEGAYFACSTLYRGMHLYGLGSPGCEDFAALGIKSVIDLRSVGEQTTYPDAPCVTEQAEMTLAPMAVPYNVSAANYVADLYELASMRAALEVLADPARYPVYVHCTYGRDRTGILAAVVLLALGASQDAILKDYRLTAEAGLSVTPDSLLAVLDEISRLGGIESYFEKVGVTPDTIDKLRAVFMALPAAG